MRLSRIEKEKILILSPVGIGNTLLLIPTLKACKQRLSGCQLTVVVFSAQAKEILEVCPFVDAIVYLNPKRVRTWLHRLHHLRRKHVDVSLTTFPTNHLLYNLLAWVIHAKTRIAHRYLVKRWVSLSFLQTIRVPMVSCHDVEQNLNLLQPIAASSSAKAVALEIWIPKEKQRWAERVIAQHANRQDQLFIGLHAGSSQKRKMTNKRWPVEKFAHLTQRLVEHHPMIRIFIFGGAEEKRHNESISHTVAQHATLVQRDSILETAALIQEMSLFISNDSGLMHIAVSVGVPTVALFGPTDAIRTAPYGCQHRVVSRKLQCRPCWPLERTGERDKCIYGKPLCLTELPVSTVFQAVVKMLESIGRLN